MSSVVAAESRGVVVACWRRSEALPPRVASVVAVRGAEVLLPWVLHREKGNRLFLPARVLRPARGSKPSFRER